MENNVPFTRNTEVTEAVTKSLKRLAEHLVEDAIWQHGAASTPGQLPFFGQERLEAADTAVWLMNNLNHKMIETLGAFVVEALDFVWVGVRKRNGITELEMPQGDPCVEIPPNVIYVGEPRVFIAQGKVTQYDGIKRSRVKKNKDHRENLYWPETYPLTAQVLISSKEIRAAMSSQRQAYNLLLGHVSHLLKTFVFNEETFVRTLPTNGLDCRVTVWSTPLEATLIDARLYGEPSIGWFTENHCAMAILLASSYEQRGH